MIHRLVNMDYLIQPADGYCPNGRRLYKRESGVAPVFFLTTTMMHVSNLQTIGTMAGLGSSVEWIHRGMTVLAMLPFSNF